MESYDMYSCVALFAQYCVCEIHVVALSVVYLLCSFSLVYSIIKVFHSLSVPLFGYFQ